MVLNYTNFYFFRFISSLKHSFLLVFFKFSIFSCSLLFFFTSYAFIVSYLVKVFGLSLNTFSYLNNLVVFEFISIYLLTLIFSILFILLFIHAFFSILTVINDYVYNYLYRLFLFLFILLFHFELILNF
jgi:hypothetical protein